MKNLLAILLLALCTGCQANTMAPPLPRNLPLQHLSQAEPAPVVVLTFPAFQYWPGVETNHSQLQCSSNLVDWETLPPIYYGAPGPTSSLAIRIDQPQQFYRMKRIDQ